MAKIGILYSTTTGIILRTINPDNDAHLDWLEQNKPAGTVLIQLNKSDVGADDSNMPNCDFLIPYVKNNYIIDLKYGVACSVVDDNGVVVDTVLACPNLYKKKLKDDFDNKGKESRTLLNGKLSQIGNTYDSKKDKFFTPAEISVLPVKDKPVFDKLDVI